MKKTGSDRRTNVTRRTALTALELLYHRRNSDGLCQSKSECVQAMAGKSSLRICVDVDSAISPSTISCKKGRKMRSRNVTGRHDELVELVQCFFQGCLIARVLAALTAVIQTPIPTRHHPRPELQQIVDAHAQSDVRHDLQSVVVSLRSYLMTRPNLQEP